MTSSNSYEADYTIAEASRAHIASIASIYAHYVAESTATFETTPPTESEMLNRWRSISDANMPFLVALDSGGDVAGYAYAGPFKPRAAYAYTVENSVYLDPGQTGRGVGKLLLNTLIERCEQLGLRQMVAVIGGADNTASIALHNACGFEPSGSFQAAGWKFDRWIDVMFMQRALGPGRSTPPA